MPNDVSLYTAITISSLVMASSPVTTSKEALSKLEAQLTCNVCLCHYTDPRTLPCLHSYCKDCISRLPIETIDGQSIVRCPSCRQATQMSEKGAAALPSAFHINNLLEIDQLLKAQASHSESQYHMCHTHNGRPKDIYCDTCDVLVCLKCIGESHSNHKYDHAEYLFTKHIQEIEECLKPVKKRIDKVEQTLACFDTREEEITKQGEDVLKEIDEFYQQLIIELQKSQRLVSQEVLAAVQEKLQLHSVQRGNVEVVLVQLKSCYDFVKEQLRSQSMYQIQMAKKQLVEHISSAHSEVIVSDLGPVQEPNITFSPNEITLSACSHIGDVKSKLSFLPDFFSADLPSRMFTDRQEKVLLMTPISLSASRMSCQLNLAQSRSAEPVVCPVTAVGEGQYRISIQSSNVGLHHLTVQVDGLNIHGSPFNIPVTEWKRQSPVRFAKGLDHPSGIAVTDSGQYVVVAEWSGHRVTVLSKAGKVVKRFGSCGNGPGKFLNPWGVAVSADKHILVANRFDMLQKFSFSSTYEASADVKCCSVAIHPNGMIFATTHEVVVLNDDLTTSRSFGDKLFDFPCDIAIDTKGILYVTDTKKAAVLKFTPEGEHLATIGSKGEQPHQFLCPLGITIDKNDIMYVADPKKHQVMMFTTEGEFIGNLVHPGSTIFNVCGVAVSKTGNLYICDADGEVLVSKPL